MMMGWPVLALPHKKKGAKRGAASTIFNDWLLRPGIEPMTSSSPEQTPYLPSYQASSLKNDNTYIFMWFMGIDR